MPDQLVTVATFSYPEHAYLSQGRLQAAGIKSFVADDHIVATNWLYSGAVGGVKLKVRAFDAGRAAEVLDEVEVSADPASYSEADDCPRCHSSHVHYEMFFIRPTFLVWYLVSFTIPFLKRKWKCHDCGFEWEERK